MLSDTKIWDFKAIMRVLSFLIALIAICIGGALFHYYINEMIVSGLPDHRRSAFPNIEEEFPDHILLKKNWKAIREEALVVFQRGVSAADASPIGFSRIYDKQVADWKVVMLKFYGREFPENLAKCPITAQLLHKLPQIKYAMFSIMEPGVRVTKHHGPFRGCLRYHLGLQVPQKNENCFIVNDNQKYAWREGEDILFDDTYEHYVENQTNQTRIVLFCDVQRQLTGWQATLNDFIVRSPLIRFFFFLNAQNEQSRPI